MSALGFSSDPYWRVEGKLDKRSRHVADAFDGLVLDGRITRYRRSQYGIWTVEVKGAAARLGGVSHAEAFALGAAQ